MVVFVARVLLGVIFTVAAATKLADRGDHRRAVAGFGVPQALAGPLGWALVLAELAAGLMLLVGPFIRVGALTVMVLAAAFSVAVVVNLARDRRPACHCFGRFSSAPIGWTTVARNGCIAAAAAFVALEGQFGWGFSVLTITLLGLWIGPRVRRNWRARAGAEAPGFVLPDTDGRTWTLEALLEPQRPLVLVFSQTGCSACDALLPEIAEWQRDIDDLLTVVVVNGGPVDDALDPQGPSRVLVDEYRATLAGYGITATPSAVLIVGERKLVAAPARGAGAIRALVDQARSLADERRFTRRRALGRAMAGLASAAAVPGVASTFGAANKASASPTGGPLQVGDVWLCDQTYALCTSAPCVRSDTDPGISVCDCVVLNGYSMGFTTCDQRTPSGRKVISTFSTDNVNENFGIMSCPSGVPWANCLDMVCEVDAANPARAQCMCQTVTDSASKTFGGGCDASRCATTIWSAATTDLPGTEQYRTGMKQLGRSVNFPKTCGS